MRYAEVSVNSPVAQRQTFSYTIPLGLSIEVGQAVWVPFGDKRLQGIVLELSHYPAVEETKEIAGIIEPRPLFSQPRVQLARWISEYYLSPLFDAVALMLPPGFERKALTFISALSIPDDFDLSTLTPKQRHALELVQRQGKVSLGQMERALGKKDAQTIVSQLVRRGLPVRSYELDSYGHVNNANYFNYLEFARGEYLLQRGLSLLHFKKWNAFPRIIRAGINYRSSAFAENVLIIECEIYNWKKTRTTLKYIIFNQCKEECSFL